jgi:hypothetical protein
VDLANPENDYCPHCGIGLYNKCGCGARKSAFARFCHACGRASGNEASGSAA